MLLAINRVPQCAQQCCPKKPCPTCPPHGQHSTQGVALQGKTIGTAYDHCEFKKPIGLHLCRNIPNALMESPSCHLRVQMTETIRDRLVRINNFLIPNSTFQVIFKCRNRNRFALQMTYTRSRALALAWYRLAAIRLGILAKLNNEYTKIAR